MLKTSQAFVTPGKLLLDPGKEAQHKEISVYPIKNLLTLPPKTPKLFSSYRSPSIPLYCKSEKPPVIPKVPEFLCEYLNYSELKTPWKKQFPITPMPHRAKTPSTLSKPKKSQSKPYKLNTSMRKSDFFESKNETTNIFYKPYYMKISPRAKVKLYSPEPLTYKLQKPVKRKSCKLKLMNSPKTELFLDANSKAKPVQISEYTRTYAGKLKMVLEISEAAKLEAEV